MSPRHVKVLDKEGTFDFIQNEKQKIPSKQIYIYNTHTRNISRRPHELCKSNQLPLREGGHKKWVHEQGLKASEGPSVAMTSMTHSLNHDKESYQRLCDAMRNRVEDGDAAAEDWKVSKAEGNPWPPDRFLERWTWDRHCSWQWGRLLEIQLNNDIIWSTICFCSCDRKSIFFCDLILMEVSGLDGIVRFIVRSVCTLFCSCLCAFNIRIRCRLIDWLLNKDFDLLVWIQWIGDILSVVNFWESEIKIFVGVDDDVIVSI